MNAGRSSHPDGSHPHGDVPEEVERLSRRQIHDGLIFRVVHEEIRLPSGMRQSLDLVEHAGAVAIAARDDEGRLLIVRQYRHALGGWTREIPAGRLEPGEPPQEAARRELEEETGFRAREWELLQVIAPAPGFCSERIHLYRAGGLEPVVGGGLACDADEELELERATPEELLSGGYEDAKTLVAAALLARRPL